MSFIKRLVLKDGLFQWEEHQEQVPPPAPRENDMGIVGKSYSTLDDILLVSIVVVPLLVCLGLACIMNW